MENNFIKFKKKILLELLIKSIIIGLLISLILFSGLLLYFKINEIKYNLLYIILISLGVFLLITGLLYLIRRPSNIKIAKRIDKQLCLNEKVQTMVAFEKDDNFMINLQREDTINILNKIPLKSFAMKFSLVSLIILFISCAVCVTAIVYPEVKDETPVIIDPSYNVDDWTIRALKDLIKEVEISEINENLKTKYLYELNQLLTNIIDVEKESEKEEIVNKTIVNIENELDVVNTNKKIYEVLKSADASPIRDLAAIIHDLTVDKMDAALDQIASTINGGEGAIGELNESFGIALRSSDLDKNDELYKQLFSLSEKLNKCDGQSNLIEAVNKAVNESKEGVIAEVSKQKLNSDMSKYVVYTLKDIFGLNNTNDGDGDDNPITNDQPVQNPNDNYNKFNPNSTDGGLGTGELIVGSDDVFFDPEKGEVKYGEVISSYYAYIMGKFKDEALSEEYEELFKNYFDLLFGNLESDEEGK